MTTTSLNFPDMVQLGYWIGNFTIVIGIVCTIGLIVWRIILSIQRKIKSYDE